MLIRSVWRFVVHFVRHFPNVCANEKHHSTAHTTIGIVESIFEHPRGCGFIVANNHTHGARSWCSQIAAAVFIAITYRIGVDFVFLLLY